MYFDIWSPRNVSEACYSVCRLPEDQCVLTSCSRCFVTQFSNEIHPEMKKTTIFFHRSSFRRVKCTRFSSLVTGIISSFSPICFSVQQFFFATSFRILHFVCGFTVTNVLATLYGIVSLCSFFFSPQHHVCRVLLENARVFLNECFSQHLFTVFTNLFPHRNYPTSNIFMNSFVVYSRHNFMFPQFYKVSYSFDNFFCTSSREGNYFILSMHTEEKNHRTHKLITGFFFSSLLPVVGCFFFSSGDRQSETMTRDS